jgi:hypothetical protein
MSATRADYVNRVIDLYIGAPDTADMPRDTDCTIAGAMYDAGISLEIVEFAFHIAFLRRYLPNLERVGYSPEIRSLAYFRAVIDSLTSTERDPAYMAYIASSYAAKRDDPGAYLRRFQESATQLREKISDRR